MPVPCLPTAAEVCCCSHLEVWLLCHEQLQKGRPVTSGAEQVLRSALGLTPVERAELIERLVLSFDRPGEDRSVDSAWLREIESRLDAYDSGRLEASPAEDVLARINRR